MLLELWLLPPEARQKVCSQSLHPDHSAIITIKMNHLRINYELDTRNNKMDVASRKWSQLTSSSLRAPNPVGGA
jgi:hypothetical protein